MSNYYLSLSFVPVVPEPILVLLGILLAGSVFYGVLRRARGSLLRMLTFALVLLTLAGPRHQEEQRTPQNDVAVVIVDRSPSQLVEGRTEQVNEALGNIRTQLEKYDDIDLRVVETSANAAKSVRGLSDEDTGTELIRELARATASIPRNRFAGAVLLSDGQVHDLDDQALQASLPKGAIHTLLSGEKESFDRRLVIEEIPAYGLVGQETELVFRVEQTRGPGASYKPVGVSLAIDGKTIGVTEVRPGRSTTFQFTLEHADASVIELSAEPAEGELSLINNTGVASINGVRDRLRVLLVSGQPHAGERMWRNLLKSDPAVDLVHFTILRPPEKSDFTPIRELSLITFPTFELFDLRIDEFDLMVFDRYMVRHVLSPRYFRNIGEYLQNGGGIMVAMGPEYAGNRSLYETALGPLLPSRPTGEIFERGFTPRLTDDGMKHPVTSDLSGVQGGNAKQPGWGRWFRQIDTVSQSGTVVMEAMDDRPLLTLDRIGNGRVGVLTSDHIWLWARGFEGGGPQAELVRRLAHWLMKEPALEEERLSAKVIDGTLQITRRSLDLPSSVVSVTTPTGSVEAVQLETMSPGRAIGRLPVSAPGVYRIDDGTLRALAAVGSLNPLEYRDLRATDEGMKPLSKASGGGVFWLSDGVPEIRRTKPGNRTVGTDWIGLRTNQSYVVSGVAEIPLLPWWLSAALITCGLFASWWREGR